MVSLDCLWVVVVSVSDRQLSVTHLETPSVSLQSISGVGHNGQKYSWLDKSFKSQTAKKKISV